MCTIAFDERQLPESANLPITPAMLNIIENCYQGQSLLELVADLDIGIDQSQLDFSAIASQQIDQFDFSAISNFDIAYKFTYIGATLIYLIIHQIN